MAGSGPAQVLAKAGWARSVGGANPYLTLFARAGTAKEEADAAARRLQIHELPSARGCTYVLPACDYALGLTLSQAHQRSGDEAMAKRRLGVTEEELQRLCDAVLVALVEGPLEPIALKEKVGGAVRSLGEEGKKRGLNSTMPLALGRLQSSGQIRRVAAVFDTQRYAYAIWADGPLRGQKLEPEEAAILLAKRYFDWLGVASIANFGWFSGFGVGACKAALASVSLREVPGTDLLATKEALDELRSWVPLQDPQVRLVSSLDSLFLHRRDVRSFLDQDDLAQLSAGEKGLLEVGHLMDLSNNAIVDRGRIIGLWEYDQEAGELVWTTFGEVPAEVRRAVQETESFVREQLGDARSFSLDSPKSRRPRIEGLRRMVGVKC